MNRLRFIPALAVATFMVAAVSSCSSGGSGKAIPNTSTSGTLVMACDASFENIMEEEIEVFEYIYPDAHILPYYVDENAAVDSLLNGHVKMIVTARPLTSDEDKYLRKGRELIPKSKKIAVDAIAVIVNPDNPIENLSVGELMEILTGKVTKWDELSPTMLGDIQVIFDHGGSSVVKYMTDSLMNGRKFPSNVYSAESIPGVFNAVKDRKNAIGLVGVSWIARDLKTADMSAEDKFKTLEKDDTTTTDFVNDVKVLPIRRNNSLVAVKPYQAYIFDGTYPLFRSIYMTYTASNGTLAHGFFTFVTSFQGQKLMQTTGVLPATVSHRQVEVN